MGLSILADGLSFVGASIEPVIGTEVYYRLVRR
jgi:hypothetical protein